MRRLWNAYEAPRRRLRGACEAPTGRLWRPDLNPRYFVRPSEVGAPSAHFRPSLATALGADSRFSVTVGLGAA